MALNIKCQLTRSTFPLPLLINMESFNSKPGRSLTLKVVWGNTISNGQSFSFDLAYSRDFDH